MVGNLSRKYVVQRSANRCSGVGIMLERSRGKRCTEVGATLEIGSANRWLVVGIMLERGRKCVAQRSAQRWKLGRQYVVRRLAFCWKHVGTLETCWLSVGSNTLDLRWTDVGKCLSETSRPNELPTPGRRCIQRRANIGPRCQKQSVRRWPPTLYRRRDSCRADVG